MPRPLSIAISGIWLLLLPLIPSRARAQILDHLECITVSDKRQFAAASYAADLISELPAVSLQKRCSPMQTSRVCSTDADCPFAGDICVISSPRCTIRMKGVQLCIDASKESVNPTPPGALPGPAAPDYLCYRAKCDDGAFPVRTLVVSDQFGSGPIDLTKPSRVCAPAVRPCGEPQIDPEYCAELGLQVCQEACLDGDGNVVLPAGATNTSPVLSVDDDTGNVHDLYSSSTCNTDTDTWYGDPQQCDGAAFACCPHTIGGPVSAPALDISASNNCPTCVGGLLDGASCASDLDCRGICNHASSCQGGPNEGQECLVGSECPSGVCAEDPGGFCVGLPTTACAVDADCQAGTCDPDAVCIPTPDLTMAGNAVLDWEANEDATWPSPPTVPAPSTDCTSRLLDPNSPFGGRDIVFVHGFDPIPTVLNLVDRQPRWPNDLNAFLLPSSHTYPSSGGIWRQRAEAYWSEHIEKYLVNPTPTRNAKNRYLVVGWSSAQRMRFGVSAVLNQVAGAMYDGTGVEFLDSNDQIRDPLCFCRSAPQACSKGTPCSNGSTCTLGADGRNGVCSKSDPGCVYISHSTGAPLADVALTVAAQTDPDVPATFNPTLHATFGNLGYIADTAKAHVALNGAFSGSHLGTVVIGGVLALNFAKVTGIAKSLFWKVFQAVTETPAGSGVGDLNRLLESVLVDLVPPVMQRRWQQSDPLNLGTAVNMGDTKVPVLTVAGGSDLGYPRVPIVTDLLNLFIQPGFDDGTVPMDSSCAKGTAWPAWPSGFYPKGFPLFGFLRLIDLGMPCVSPAGCQSFPFGKRSTKYLYAQQIEPIASLVAVPLNPRSAAGCVPYKAPWGMLEPVRSLPGALDPLYPLARLRNHFSFLQTSEDHAGDLNGENYVPDIAKGTPDERNEETRAIGDASVYNLGLVSSSMKNIERENVRGSKIEFDILFTHFEWWIWKRTYHRPVGWESKLGDDYVYDYVLK